MYFFFNDSIGLFCQKFSDNSIDRIELFDGSYLTNTDIENVTQQMNAYITENNLDIQTTQDLRNNTDLVQIIQAGWQN